MEYVKLGNSELVVSRFCLGCMSFGDASKWIHPWVLDEERSGHRGAQRAYNKARAGYGHQFF